MPDDGNAADGNAADGNAADGNAADGNAADGKVADGKAADEKAARAAYHVEAARRRKAAESAQARVLLEEFVREARERGLSTSELVARPWNRRGRYRTGRVGWYLKRDHSIGIDTDGGYFLLVVAPERFGRWRGVVVPPSDPPLQVGEGARDGESAPLAEFLRLRLEAGDAFP